MIDMEGRALRDDNGKIRFAATIRWATRDLSDTWSAAVVELVLSAHPNALDDGVAP
jgi:hypothetical protein